VVNILFSPLFSSLLPSLDLFARKEFKRGEKRRKEK
jgi:hypothetical protein